MTTLLAEVMFKPTPPARVEMRKIKVRGELLKLKTARTPREGQVSIVKKER